VLIFAVIVAILVYGMIAAMLGTILPDLSDRFHLSPSQNGTIALAQALGLILASLGVGPLLDSEGPRYSQRTRIRTGHPLFYRGRALFKWLNSELSSTIECTYSDKSPPAFPPPCLQSREER
jgi:fucose permease